MAKFDTANPERNTLLAMGKRMDDAILGGASGREAGWRGIRFGDWEPKGEKDRA